MKIDLFVILFTLQAIKSILKSFKNRWYFGSLLPPLLDGTGRDMAGMPPPPRQDRPSPRGQQPPPPARTTPRVTFNDTL